MKFLQARARPLGVSVMRDIKRALDPGNLMNPGKIVEM